MEKVMNFLEDEVLNRFDELKELEPGSEEYSRLNADTCNMAKVYLDCVKIEKDADEKEIRRKIEESIKIEDLKEKRKDKWIDVCLTAGTSAATIGCYILLFGLGLKFEESGTFRSKMFTNLYNKIRPSQIK